MKFRSVLSTMALGFAVLFSHAAFAIDYKKDAPPNSSVYAGAVEADEKLYRYSGPDINAEYWEPAGRSSARVTVTIRDGIAMRGSKVKEYVQRGILRESTILRKLAVVGLVAGALGAGHGSAEASTVRVQPEAGKPIPLSVTSNVGEVNNSFESFAGRNQPAPQSAQQTTRKATTSR